MSSVWEVHGSVTVLNLWQAHKVINFLHVEDTDFPREAETAVQQIPVALEFTY